MKTLYITYDPKICSFTLTDIHNVGLGHFKDVYDLINIIREERNCILRSRESDRVINISKLIRDAL